MVLYQCHLEPAVQYIIKKADIHIYTGNIYLPATFCDLLLLYMYSFNATVNSFKWILQYSWKDLPSWLFICSNYPSFQLGIFFAGFMQYFTVCIALKKTAVTQSKRQRKNTKLEWRIIGTNHGIFTTKINHIENLEHFVKFLCRGNLEICGSWDNRHCTW